MAPAAPAPIPDIAAGLFRFVPVDQLRPSPTNPRKHADPVKLAELAASIKQQGIIQPIVVRQVNGHFEIVAGERRFRAATLADLDVVPVLIREFTDEQVLEVQLIENIHRFDMTPLDQAVGYRRLIAANPTKHSAESIASRIGMSVAWVWDRLKLNDLVPEAKALLDQERMSIGHAILISRLKPDQQLRVIDPEDGGLFTGDSAGLDWDAEVGDAKRKPGKYDDLKPRSIRELEKWIADHIRFDAQHAAAAAPLVFEEVAQRVAEAAAKPGRGKKVIAITFDHFVQPDARSDAGERTYGPRAFKFADGQKHTDDFPRRTYVAQACEHAVLGVVAAGEKYGQAFEVCVSRDKCEIHFKKEIAEREKNAALRAKGQTKKAAKNEQSAEDKYRKQREERERQKKAWDALSTAIRADAVDQVKGAKTLTPAAAKLLDGVDIWNVNHTLTKHLGKDWFKSPGAAAWLVLLVADEGYDSFDDYVTAVAKPLGLNLKRLEAIRDKHQPPAAAPAKAASKKPATKKR